MFRVAWWFGADIDERQWWKIEPKDDTKWYQLVSALRLPLPRRNAANGVDAPTRWVIWIAVDCDDAKSVDKSSFGP
jgi:hypothetical protein